MSNSVSLKMLGQKLVKLDCIIISLDLDTIKKARNELDRTCGWSVVFFCNRFFLICATKKYICDKNKDKKFYMTAEISFKWLPFDTIAKSSI